MSQSPERHASRAISACWPSPGSSKGAAPRPGSSSASASAAAARAARHLGREPARDQAQSLDVGARGGVRAMGHEDDGGAALVGLRPQLVEDHAGVAVVEIAGGLVGEQERRTVEHRAAERDALLLAAGELRGVVPPTMGDAQTLQERLGVPRRLAAVPARRSARRGARCPARSGRR